MNLNVSGRPHLRRPPPPGLRRTRGVGALSPLRDRPLHRVHGAYALCRLERGAAEAHGQPRSVQGEAARQGHGDDRGEGEAAGGPGPPGQAGAPAPAARPRPPAGGLTYLRRRLLRPLPGRPPWCSLGPASTSPHQASWGAAGPAGGSAAGAGGRWAAGQDWGRGERGSRARHFLTGACPAFPLRPL